MATFRLSRSVWFWFFPALILVVSSCVGGVAPQAVAQAASAAPAQSTPQLEPKAIEILKAACAKLAVGPVDVVHSPGHL